MGKVAMQTLHLQEGSIENAYQEIKEAGFDAVDANVEDLFTYRQIGQKEIPAAFRPDLSENEFLSYFKPFKEASIKYDLENYQAHALFPTLLSGEDDPEYNAFLLNCLKRTIRAMDYIDCRNLIVHPFFRGFSAMVSPEEEWEKNIESYSALIPAAKEYGVRINLENMFRVRDGKVYEAICGDPEEACRYIDTLNEIAGAKVFGFCLDTGHVNLCGRNLADVMTTLGDRITCFHVHDNDSIHDQHYVPFWGNLNWDSFVEGLAKIGYRNVLSCEGGEAWKRVPKEIRKPLLQFTQEAMRHLYDRAEKLMQ